MASLCSTVLTTERNVFSVHKVLYGLKATSTNGARWFPMPDLETVNCAPPIIDIAAKSPQYLCMSSLRTPKPELDRWIVLQQSELELKTMLWVLHLPQTDDALWHLNVAGGEPAVNLESLTTCHRYECLQISPPSQPYRPNASAP